ncbi:MAG: glucose-1-phosphate cytidylyltransferase [Gemmataceae bacterium]
MQVVILCGGQGVRIRDQFEALPKPLIPVGPRPIVWHIMKYYAHFGFREFILCLGYRRQMFVDYFVHYRWQAGDITVDLGRPGHVECHGAASEDWRVTLADTGLHTPTGGRLRRIAAYVRGQTFLATYGDGLATVDLHELIAFHQRQGRLATVTAVHPGGRFGEMEIEADRVVRFAEKPQTSAGWINGGFFVFEREFLARYLDTDDCVLEADALTRCARDGQLAAYRHEGFWQCMDTAREHQLLEELWQQGMAPWKIWLDPEDLAAWRTPRRTTRSTGAPKA